MRILRDLWRAWRHGIVWPIMLLACAARVEAQAIAPSPQGLTAQFSSTCAAATCATWAVGTATSVTVSVTGAGSWTGTFKASSDNGNTYFDATMIRLSDRSTTTTVTDTGDGQYGIVNSGITHLQFRLTTWASGGANVWAIRGYGSLAANPFAQQVLAPASGGCTTPSYSFVGDTDSGIGWLGANNPAGCAGGATSFDWNTTRLLAAIPIYFASGTAGAPGLAFGSDASNDSGAYLIGADNIGFSAGGTLRWDYNTTRILSTIPIGLPAGAIGAASLYLGGDTGTGLYRTGTNELAATANSTQLMRWTQGGTVASVLFAAASSNTVDIGQTATTFRTGYFGTSVVSPILQGSGTGVSVANVGANSCGTTAATISGNQVSGKITVGATSGTQCRVTFSTAAPVSRDCTVTDETTTIATRATYVSTTTHDFLGAFVAGDLVTYICTVR